MKKRNKKYTPKQVSAPAMVMREQNIWHFEGEELLTVDAFKRGLATEHQMKLLEDWTNLICIANAANKAGVHQGLENTLCGLTQSIFSRALRKGSYALTAKERELLPAAIRVYQQYWKCRNAGFFNQCLAVLENFYKTRTDLVFFNGQPMQVKEKAAA